MVIRRQINPDGSVLGVWHITETPEELLQAFPSDLQGEAQRVVMQFKSPRRIKEWLSTRLLLAALVGEMKTISNDVDGKPFLKDQSYHISLSHTSNYVAILLHSTKPVGIDIETISLRVSKVASRFISDEEMIDSSYTIVHQLLHWCAKETLYKLVPNPQSDFRRYYRIEPFVPQSSGQMVAHVETLSASQRIICSYDVLDDYVLTWAVGE